MTNGQPKHPSVTRLAERIDARNRRAAGIKLAVDKAQADYARIGAGVAPPSPDDELSCAGAAPIMQGGRLYAEPGGVGTPNVSVLVMGGQCAVTTEREATLPMSYAVHLAGKACAEAMCVTQWGDDEAQRLHAHIVSWLRKEWAVGRLSQKDGVWHYRPDTEEA